MRIGGWVFSITRLCTDEVWVRRSTSGLRWMKKVSCMSRAGWSSAKLSEENTCQSSSISGPSAMVKPRREKIETISLRTSESGWRVPRGIEAAVRERSMSAAVLSAVSSASRRAFRRSVARFLSSLSFCPSSRFCSAGTLRKSAMSSDTAPFLLRYLMRRASTSWGVLASRASISAFS